MLDTIWQQTITNAGALWTALAALATFLAVLVAILLPLWTLHSERRAREQRAKAILPALLEEADRIGKQASAAAALVTNQMSGVLQPCDSSGKRLLMDGSFQNQPFEFCRFPEEAKKKQLQSLALVNIPIIEAFGQLLVDLPHSTSAILIRNYGQMVLARQSIGLIARSWEALQGIPLDRLREYRIHADSMVSACLQMKIAAAPRPRKRPWGNRQATKKPRHVTPVGVAGKPLSDGQIG